MQPYKQTHTHTYTPTEMINISSQTSVKEYESTLTSRKVQEHPTANKELQVSSSTEQLKEPSGVR